MRFQGALKERSAVMNVKDYSGAMPLHQTVHEGAVDVIHSLLDHTAV